MNVYRGNIADVQSCNCCLRGTLRKSGMGLEYPYTEVTVIEGNAISMRLCDQCLEELKSKI